MPKLRMATVTMNQKVPRNITDIKKNTVLAMMSELVHRCIKPIVSMTNPRQF